MSVQKYSSHYGVELSLSICKTVSVETPVQHSVYDNDLMITVGLRSMHTRIYLALLTMT